MTGGGNNGNLMCTFNIKEGEEGHDGQIWSCTVDEKNKRMYSVGNGSKLLLSGAWDGIAKLWDTRMQKPCILSWEAHRQNISGMTFFGQNFAFLTPKS